MFRFKRNYVLTLVMILMRFSFRVIALRHSIHIITTQQARVAGGKGEDAKCNGRVGGVELGKNRRKWEVTGGNRIEAETIK